MQNSGADDRTGGNGTAPIPRSIRIVFSPSYKSTKKTHTIDRIRRRFITTPHCRRHFIRYFRNATGPACRPVKTRNSRCDTAAPRRRAGRAFACGGPQYASSADFALQIRKPPILTTKAFADCALRTINQNFQLQGITFALGKKQINLHCPRLFVSLTLRLSHANKINLHGAWLNRTFVLDLRHEEAAGTAVRSDSLRSRRPATLRPVI